MLPANSVSADRVTTLSSLHGEHNATCIERLVHRLLSAHPDSQDMTGDGLDAALTRSTCPGFDWHAPFYEAPRSMKDTIGMHNAARDDRPAPAENARSVFRWRRHPALLKPAPESALPDEVRLARVAAVKGVLAARDGDLDAATAWFTEAAQEPSIRFQVVPGFWGCTRGGMDAAVLAYEATGRLRDAAALAATIRTRFRPRMVNPGRPASTPMEIGRRTWRGEPSAGTGD
ncbi:MAG: hypothetical protein QM753_15375 [Thermomicrobiales bacterium]